MVLDGLRGYLELANGLSDVTRERARVAAKSLVAQGEASVGAVLPESLKAQVASLTEDLIATSKANRALLIGLVGTEVERATAHLGLAMARELDSAKSRAQRLEQRVADLERQVREALAGSAPSTSSAAQGTAAQKASATKSTARQSTAKKSTTRKAAKKTAAKKTTAKRVTAKKTTAKKTTAKKTTAKTTT
jgi:polyhydroxyalkanoate synthesis regulator phasin